MRPGLMDGVKSVHAGHPWLGRYGNWRRLACRSSWLSSPAAEPGPMALMRTPRQTLPASRPGTGPGISRRLAAGVPRLPRLAEHDLVEPDQHAPGILMDVLFVSARILAFNDRMGGSAMKV